ncbi:terpenoid synthase [Hypoxylon sp. FL1857]|nr:terpenoid synthase [Hypoxylon sp. FL1857]
MSSNQVDVKLLLAKCVGQKVKIPDLFALCPWDVEVSPWSEKLEREVELWRSRWIDDPTSLKRNRIVDPCLFARGVAPKAAFDELVIMSKWVAWTMALINNILSTAYDFGEFDDRPQEVTAHREQTIELFRQSLFNKSPSCVNPATTAPGYLTAQSVHEWAAVVGEKSISASLKNWTFEVFVNSCTAISRLQHEFDEGTILNLETYWNIRMDSSAFLPTLAVVLFTDQVAFPDWFFDHKLVRKAAELANTIIWITNDIASARYELQCKHVDNFIPLLVHHKGITPQEAVDEAGRATHQAYLDFEALEPQLTRLGESRGVAYEMQRFIASCRFACTGIFHWT